MVLTLIHVNDAHGQLELYAQAASLARARHAIFVDAGDVLEATSLRCAATRGEAAARLLRVAGVAAITVGNAELLHYGVAGLERIADISRVPILSANLSLEDGNSLPGTRPWTLIDHRGQSVAILGLTVPLVKPYAKLGVHALDPVTVAGELIPWLRSKAEFVVVLSHLGLWDDEEISKIPGIDVVIGGHSHHLLNNPHSVGGSPIVQASTRGRWIGEVTLGKARVEGHLHVAANVAPASDVVSELSQIDTETETWGHTVVTTLLCSLSRAQLGHKIANLLKKATEASAAILLEGIVTNGLQEGSVNRHQLHQVLPFALHPAVVHLKGGELLGMLERAYDPAHRDRRPDMLRGRRLGSLYKSGLEVHLDTKGRHSRVRRVIVGGQPLRLQQTYRLAMSELETSQLAESGCAPLEVQLDTNVLLSDILEQGLS